MKYKHYVAFLVCVFFSVFVVFKDEFNSIGCYFSSKYDSQVDGVVYDKKVVVSGRAKRTEIFYRFEFRGIVYSSKILGFGYVDYKKRNFYKIDDMVMVYFDQANPQCAVLDKNISLLGFSRIFGLILLCWVSTIGVNWYVKRL